MLNMVVALLVAVAGLSLAWWNHRRLKRIRGRLDFAQTATGTLFTMGSVMIGVILAYVVAFPPDGTPLLGQGKVMKNDVDAGKRGKYRGPND